MKVSERCVGFFLNGKYGQAEFLRGHEKCDEEKLEQARHQGERNNRNFRGQFLK